MSWSNGINGKKVEIITRIDSIDIGYVFAKWMAVALLVIFLLSIASTPAYAYPLVAQMDTIYQGETYDLSAVIGFGDYTGQFARWNSGDDDAPNTPANHINLFEYPATYRQQNYTIFSVYIDPNLWVTGNWYKWTGNNNARSENTFAFTVAPSRKTKQDSVIPNAESQFTSVPTGLQSQVITLVPTAQPAYPASAVVTISPITSDNNTVVIAIVPTIIPTEKVTAMILAAAATVPPQYTLTPSVTPTKSIRDAGIAPVITPIVVSIPTINPIPIEMPIIIFSLIGTFSVYILLKRKTWSK